MFSYNIQKRIEASRKAPYGTTHILVNFGKPIYFSVEVTTGKLYRYLENPNGWVLSVVWKIQELYSNKYQMIHTRYAPTIKQIKYLYIGVQDGKA